MSEPDAISEAKRHLRLERLARGMLGVSASASLEEIKTAFRRLAARYHPDKCSGDDCRRRFMAALGAYEYLAHGEDPGDLLDGFDPKDIPKSLGGFAENEAGYIYWWLQTFGTDDGETKPKRPRKTTRPPDDGRSDIIG